MKKYNLLKVILITILAVFMLTLMIPATQYGKLGETVGISSIGLVGIIAKIPMSINLYCLLALLLLATSCFYGVLRTLTVYDEVVSKISNKFKGKDKLLVIVTMIIFAVLSLFVSDFMILIVFVPFVIDIMKKLDIDNKYILSSTLVPSIIGTMCGIYDNNLFALFGLKITSLLLFKLIVFALSLVALILFAAPKKEEKQNKVKKTIAEKKESNKIDANDKKIERVIFKTSMVLFFIFIITAIIPWNQFFTKFDLFTKINDSLDKFGFGGYDIFANIFGSKYSNDAIMGETGNIRAIGSFTKLEISSLLLILTLVVSFVEKIKFDDLVAKTCSSVKKVLPILVALFTIGLTLFITVDFDNGNSILFTIIDKLNFKDNFNVVTASLASLLGSIFTGDFYYFLVLVGRTIADLIDSKYLVVCAFVLQSVYNLALLFVPTSAGLIIGLYYFDIPFGKWFKHIWKVLLSIFAVIIIVSIIAVALV